MMMKMMMLMMMVSVLSVCLLIRGIHGKQPTPKEWSALPPMNSGPRKWSCGGVLHLDDGSDLFLAVGGFYPSTAAHILKAVEAFDPTENKWTQLKPMIHPHMGCAAATIGTRMFVMGGGASAYTEMYDFKTGLWTSLPLMTTARQFAATAAVDQKIYIFGGLDYWFPLATAEVYDTVTKTWSALPPMPGIRNGGCAAAVGNTIYIMGGIPTTTLNQKLDTVYTYNVETQQYSTISTPPMNHARHGCVAVTSGTSIYVIGGHGLSSVEVYNTVKKTWTLIPSMSTERWGSAAGLVNGQLIVAGGVEVNHRNVLDTVEQISVCGGGGNSFTRDGTCKSNLF